MQLKNIFIKIARLYLIGGKLEEGILRLTHTHRQGEREKRVRERRE